ncbi:MAG TPA: TIM-barrel domain-containing protein [Bacteroidales bacterium]|nr:TIM-barrel domain-containing protein [Bacteroidales bacterium]
MSITRFFIACSLFATGAVMQAQVPVQPGHPQYILNEPYDISGDFYDFTNTYYVADSLTDFDPQKGSGTVVYERYENSTRLAFNNMMGVLKKVNANEFPTNEYAASPALPFSIEFVSPKTIRIKASTGFEAKKQEPSLMLVNGQANVDTKSWKYTRTKDGYLYSGEYGTVLIRSNPWTIEFRDKNGYFLTRTVHISDLSASAYIPELPFSFVRRAGDYSRSVNAAFLLSPDEKIFGCGESFTRLDKRGQKVVLWTDDANGVENEAMYKPIPFFMSSRGYGMFMHTSSPITCDFGKYFGNVNSLMIGDDQLDLFVFLGDPKDILDEYTNLTGKPSMPPLWSFGLWMSRITYFSEADGRRVAAMLRQNRIPSDVIHFDTGWFETDWQCDYKFAPSRFTDAGKMLSDLKNQGFHVSLWQIPYFVPKNSLFSEIIDKGLYVKNDKGNPPYEDAILDFSNPATVSWYQEKIGGLLKMGVGAIKVDFGEAAPQKGIYASGKTGFYEHNLYPLRYNKTVAEITKEINGENIIWARSAWAGSQRYPLHWGGDAEVTNNAMESELRGGLSFGLSGFAFWSHDIGGFQERTPDDLYRRWLPFGMLTSHSRCHGTPPKEPWEYGQNFNDYFRVVDEMKYKLMPYIYAQAKNCTEKGLPMVRALFVEYPDDPGAWQIENEYLFGSDILVAPLFESTTSRDVYLPGGNWIDFQTGKSYSAGWHTITAGEIQAVILVRDGAVIPTIQLAQSTMDMDWTKIDLNVYSGGKVKPSGLICLPSDNVLHQLNFDQSGKLISNPLQGKSALRVVKR